MKNAPLAAETRPIRLLELFALVLLWNSGYKGARVLNTLYALELGAKPFEIGLLLATYGLFALVLAVYAGRVSDRYGVRMPVVGGVITSVAGILLPYSPPGRAGETIGLRIAINNSMHVVVPTAFGGLGSPVGIGPVFWLSSAVLGAGAYVARRRKT
jgi:MFS family permease